MFSNFISALQGADANDSDDEGAAPLPDEQPGSGSEGAPSSAYWTANLTGFASGFAKSVQLKTAEIASSVAKTDWRSELTAFTSEVKRDAQTVGQEARHAVEHLPESAQEAWKKPPQPPPALAGAQLDEVRRFGASLLQGTSEIFTEVSKTVVGEIEKAGKGNKREPRARGGRAAMAAVNGKYSRFETEVSAIQRDSSTYCDEPEDLEDYARFGAGFVLAEKQADIDALLKSNAFMAELHSRIVPLIVENGDFWARYFYRLSKLQEKHDKRQALALRAQEQQAEEEIGWGDEEEEEPEAPAEGLVGPSGSAAAATIAVEGEEKGEKAGQDEGEAEEAASPQAPAIHVEEVPRSPMSAASSPAASPRDPPAPVAAAPEEEAEAASVSSSVVQVSSAYCKSDGEPAASDAASGDWCVMSASPASSSPNRAVADAPPKDVVTTQEPAPAPAESLPPPSSDEAATTAKPDELLKRDQDGFDEFISDEDDEFLSAPGPAPSGKPGALGDEDEDDLDEDWGAN